MADKNYPYDDFGDDDFEGVPTAPARDEKMQRILDELTALKSNLAKAKAAKTPSPSQNADILAELTRLREESANALSAQQALARQDRAAQSASTQIYAELQRLSARLDAMERTADYRAYEPRPQPRVYGGDEINLRLNKLENLLNEISVMTIANDVAPITKELAELKALVADGDAAHALSDKILDELVGLQTSVEDLRATVEESRVDDPFGDTPIIQDNLFDAKTLERISDLEALVKDNFARLDEQVSSIATDLHIFGGEEYARPAALGTPCEKPDLSELAKKSDVEKMTVAMERMADALTLTVATLGAKGESTGASQVTEQLDGIASTMQAVLDRLTAIEGRLGESENDLRATVREVVKEELAVSKADVPVTVSCEPAKTDIAEQIAELSGALDAFAAEEDEVTEATPVAPEATTEAEAAPVAPESATKAEAAPVAPAPKKKFGTKKAPVAKAKKTAGDEVTVPEKKKGRK